MPERIKPSCQYNLSNTSSIYLQIYALGRGKKSTKRKKFHEEQKDHKCKQAYFHFPTFPKLLLVLVFHSVSTGTYFISFDNTKMNLDVIEIWQATYILGYGYIPIHILRCILGRIHEHHIINEVGSQKVVQMISNLCPWLSDQGPPSKY